MELSNYNLARNEYESEPDEYNEDWEQEYDQYCDDLVDRKLEEALDL